MADAKCRPEKALHSQVLIGCMTTISGLRRETISAKVRANEPGLTFQGSLYALLVSLNESPADCRLARGCEAAHHPGCLGARTPRSRNTGRPAGRIRKHIAQIQMQLQPYIGLLKMGVCSGQ